MPQYYVTIDMWEQLITRIAYALCPLGNKIDLANFMNRHL